MTNIPYENVAKRLNGERVMLVGGAGFIGHNLSLALRRIAVETMVVDNLMINSLTDNVFDGVRQPLQRQVYLGFLLDRFELMRGAGVVLRNADARLMVDLSRLFDEFLPTKVIHLAAIASAVEARADPGLCFDLQLVTLRNGLELCRMSQGRVNQIMLMSSSTVYGDFKEASVDENTRPRPKGIYASTKYMAERLVRTYIHQHGVGGTIIRPSALYGERCISRRVSQVFVENALLGKPLYLEGGGDGRLDFTNIDDLVQGMVRALALESGHMMTFNLTYGNARTIADLAAILKEYVPEVTIEERPPAPEKPRRGTLLVDRAREYLDFAPTVALDEGYRRYCAWYLEEWARLGRN